MSIVINLEYKPYLALFRRLSEALRKAILEGRLAPGEPLPSIRELSENLKLSRATVCKAYNDLHLQGLVESRSGSGTIVARKLPEEFAELLAKLLQETQANPHTSGAQADLSARGRLIYQAGSKLTNEHVHYQELDFSETPLESPALRQWKNLLLKHCDLAQTEDAARTVASYGIAPLREAIAMYLARRRSIIGSPEDVLVFGSKQLRADLVGRMLLNPGDLVAFEEPGNPETRFIFEALEAKIAPIRVDENGLSVEELRALPQPPKLIYVTPSHQDPLTVVMSLPRRKELLNYAAISGAFILEDDLDSEFRYGKATLPALKALDQDDSVIYLGSFCKVLYQTIRLGYALFPQCLQKEAALLKSFCERHLPLVEQYALTDFISEGYLETHLSRCQKTLAVRRQALILAITRYLRNEIRPLTEGGGSTIMLHFHPRQTDANIEQAAQESSFKIFSAADYFINEAPSGLFIAPFADIDNEKIDQIVQNFACLLQKQGESQ
jgi:GntR family transcriptional regulator/MocR family aminotransferase